MLKAIAQFPQQVFDRVTGRTERKLRTALRASYDAARQSRLMDKYWENAEIQAANAAHNPAVQKITRARSRYEFGNNPFVQRMVLQKANDVIGTCPRVQLNSPSDLANRFIESQWASWGSAVHLGAKLRLQHVCRQVDGIGLGLKAFNPRIPHPVKLDVKVADADRLHTPDLFMTGRDRSDGIRKDSFGNIVAFDLLRDHPAADYAIAPFVYDTIPAEYVMYWISPRFAEQDRTVPETTAILNLCGQSRRYRQTVLTAAELAAAIAGIMRTNTGAVTEAADEDEIGDMIQMEMGFLLTVPKGWTMEQMKAEQPTTTYAEFTNEQSKEQAAGMGMSHHKATGDYAKTNFVSGKLADRDYLGNVDIERHDLGEQHLTPLFCDFAQELALQGLMPAVPALSSEQTLPYIPALQGAAGYMRILGRDSMANWLKGNGVSVPTLEELTLAPQELHAAGYHEAAEILQQLPHEWFWDAPRDIEPTKEAIARQTKLKSGLTNRRRELKLSQGIDIDVHDAQAAKDLGLTVDEYRRRVTDALFGTAKTGANAGSSSSASPKPRTGSAAGNRRRSGVPDDAAADTETSNRLEELLTV